MINFFTSNYILCAIISKLFYYKFQTKDENIDFDVDVAIQVCRQSSPEKALALAEKHGRHSLYIKILLEDRHEYVTALEYIEKLSIEEVQSF